MGLSRKFSVLVNLVELDPPRNGGVSRVAYIVSKALAERFESGALDVVFVVGWRFALRFQEWIGKRDLQVVPFGPEGQFTPFFSRLRPDLIVSPLFGMFPFRGEDNPYPDVPHIAFMPDALALDLPNLFSEEEVRDRRRAYEDLRQAALVITLSQYARQRLIAHLGLPPERVRVISLGADVYQGEEPSLPDGVSQPYIYYPANGWPHKRHDLLLQAMKHIWTVRPDLSLVLTGWFPEGYLDELFARLQCPREKIVALGYVQDSEVVALYRHAEALMFTSAYEGFGMPIVEAMLNGCPVICAPVTSLPEVAGDAALYVESDDPSQWARAFLEKLPRQRAQLIALGYRQAARFRWASTRASWEQAIGQILETVPQRSTSSSTPSPTSWFLEDLIAWQQQYAEISKQYAEISRDLLIKEKMIRSLAQAAEERLQTIRSLEKKVAEKDRVIRAFQTSWLFWLRHGPFGQSLLVRPLLAMGTALGYFLKPRLGVFEQYPPRPVYVPAFYRRKAKIPFEQMPVISIVTPSYNQAKFLPRTIESVLSQDYPKLEYIVQDGGSTDGTLEVLERYRDRLAYVESRPDNGQAHAINLGFSHATGEIMAYLNSDDILLPGTLHYVAEYFHRHPEVDVIYGHRVIINEHDQEIGRWVLPPHDDQVLFWADYVPQETLFWRRRVWEKIGGYIDESYQFALDWDLLLRFVRAGARIVRVPRFLAAFRVHVQQKTSAKIEEIGAQEMARIRRTYLGREVTQFEIEAAVRPYLRRAWWYHTLYRLGVLRY